MNRFKVGDTISPNIERSGFDNAAIYRIDDRFYHVRIINGTATIPLHVVNENYHLTSE